MKILYRLFPLQGSTGTIGTFWETVDRVTRKKQSVPLEIMEQYVGEQDAEELSQCLLNPATRHIEQITVDNIEEADKLFDILMGPSVPPRREYMLEHGEEARV